MRQKIPPPAARFVMLAKHHGTPLLSGDVFQWARFRNGKFAGFLRQNANSKSRSTGKLIRLDFEVDN